MNILLEKDEKNGTIKVVSPYNATFVSKCRNLRGSFKQGAWFFDDSVEEYVKQALLDVYGVDGTTPVELCTLIIKEYTYEALRSAVDLFGRSIAIAFGRDSGAKLCENIFLISGRIDSSGSVKNWYTLVENATFEIQKYPIERTKFADIQTAMQNGWVEIKIPKKSKTKEQIVLEIEQYQSKIKELQSELSE